MILPALIFTMHYLGNLIRLPGVEQRQLPILPNGWRMNIGLPVVIKPGRLRLPG